MKAIREVFHVVVFRTTRSSGTRIQLVRYFFRCYLISRFRDELIIKYMNARSNVAILKSMGATLLYGVDATYMTNLPDLRWKKFDRIIYNFPHAGFHGLENDPHLIMMHRNLVFGFLWNASIMLCIDGEVHINHKITPPFDSCRIEDLAFECSLVCIAFNIKDYPFYHNKRGSGRRSDKAFPLGSCSTFKFKLNPAAQENQRKLDGMPSGSHQMFAMPPVQVYDVNYTSYECQMLFGGYLKHVEETFGSDTYDVRRTVEEAMRFGSEMYASAVPGRPSSGFISNFEIATAAADVVISRPTTLMEWLCDTLKGNM